MTIKFSTLRKIFLPALILGSCAIAQAAPQFNVRNVNTEIDTSAIIVPESFEIDTHNLMKNWYLTRYAVMDKDADSRKSVTFEDRDYIDRLQKLPTTIEMPYNSVVKSFIRMYTERRKALVESMLGLSIYYNPIFENAFDKYGLPMELKNLAIIESALNPDAVSKAGATGLWQFMASTAQGEGLEVNSLVDERRDPYRSTDAAARYLKKLYDMYGDWTLAIAAYNCGPGNVNKALRRAGGENRSFWEIYNYLPAETRTYIPAFIAANYTMNYYKDHNISPVLAARPIIVDSVKVNRRVHFQQISDVLGIPMDELRALNPQYRADIIPGDIKPYSLILPHIQTLCYVAYEDSIVNHDAELYARAETVEPGIKKVSPETGEEYVEVTNTIYHKVKPNESLAAIAQRYNVTQQEVIRANGGRKTLKRGKTLAINVTERRPASSVAQNSNDSTSTTSQPEAQIVPAADTAQNTDSVETATQKVTAAIDNSKQKQNTQTTTPKPKTTTYKVKSGDSLYRIATNHGITLDQLRKANPKVKDNIQPGQTLVIPAKSSGRRR